MNEEEEDNKKTSFSEAQETNEDNESELKINTKEEDLFDDAWDEDDMTIGVGKKNGEGSDSSDVDQSDYEKDVMEVINQVMDGESEEEESSEEF